MAEYQNKIYSIEIAEGDKIYAADDVQAINKEQALAIARLMFAGFIYEDSEIIKLEEQTIQ